MEANVFCLRYKFNTCVLLCTTGSAVTFFVILAAFTSAGIYLLSYLLLTHQRCPLSTVLYSSYYLAISINLRAIATCTLALIETFYDV